MGQMDSKLLKDGAMAHHKAIGTIDGSGVMSKDTFTEINAALGRMIASVPESSTMDVYNSFKALVGSDVPAYMMSKVKEADAKAAYAALVDFKDVVKAHPITPTAPTSSLNVDSVVAAASKLAAASYPFAKSVDWNSDLFVKPVPGASPKDVLGAVDKMIVMGASMDGKLLKEAAEAHHKAIGSVDAKGVTSAADWEAVNGALGKDRLCARVAGHGCVQQYRQACRGSRRSGSQEPSLHCQQRRCDGSVQGVLGFQGCRQGRPLRAS